MVFNSSGKAWLEAFINEGVSIGEECESNAYIRTYIL